MSRVNIEPNLLKWAIHRFGDSDLIESKFPKLTNWLSGEIKPTFKQLENFAKATHTPLGYLFLSEPPEEQFPIPHYRTIGDVNNNKPSTNLLETVQTMKRRQDWMREYLKDIGNDPLNYVGSAKNIKNPKKISSMIREELGLGSDWASMRGTWQDALNHLLRVVQESGILVMVNGIVGNNTHRKLDVHEFRGFVLVDDYAPLIFINGADGKAAQMFTIAHELAHVWLGESAAFDLSLLQPSDNEVEKLCNAIAAELLVPEQDFILIWDSLKYQEDKYQEIARYFKVSELVAVRRALDFGMISFEDYKDFYARRETEQNERRSSGGHFHNTANWRIGPKFADALISRVKEGKTLYNEAYKLTGIKGTTFDKFVQHRERNGGL